MVVATLRPRPLFKLVQKRLKFDAVDPTRALPAQH